MEPKPSFQTSGEALTAILERRDMGSPMGARTRKALRILFVLLGLFVLGSVAVGILGKKTSRPFQEEGTSLDPYGNRNNPYNPWGRR